MKDSAAIRVGCAGWSIPSACAPAFGAGESALQRYATRFSVVEINSSFYRPHQPATYARWAAAVPADFRFSVKMPRTISHEHRLQGTGALLDRFLDESAHLGTRLGGLLLQLPPSLAFDARRVAAFLQMLRRRTAVAVVCEPRHLSWFEAEAEALLQRHDVARAAVDPALVAAAALPAAAAGWRYWRWHGSPRMYYSAYGDDALADLAATAGADRAGGTSWVIFDNTAQGFAVGNALHLQALLRGEAPTPAATPSRAQERTDA